MKGWIVYRMVVFRKLLKVFAIFVSAGISLSGCSNFLDGSALKQEIESQIEYSKAQEVEILISAEKDTGTTFPVGSKIYKETDSFTVSFKPVDGYQFLRWCVKNYKTNQEIYDVLKIENPEQLETKVTVLAKADNIMLEPVVLQCPFVKEFYPPLKEAGEPKDSSIVITFSKDLSPENDLSKIKILCSGENITENNFAAPVLNGNIITFGAKLSNLLEVNSERTKTISVIIPADLFYEEEGQRISFGTEASFSYKVNSETNVKTEIVFSAASEKGRINPEGLKKFNLGETVDLNFEPKEGYKFLGWNILDAQENEVSQSDLSFTSRDLVETKFTIYSKLNGVSITPKCELIPAVKSVLPENKIEGVLCYTPIVFNFNMSMSAEDLDGTFQNISVKNSLGQDISGCFNLPELSADGKVLTIRPRGDKIREYVNVVSTSDILVTIKKGVLPQTANGLFLEEFTYTYRINNTLVTTVPQINSVIISKDMEQNKILSAHKFDSDEWEEEDFEVNHLSKELYISLSATDTVSGVKSFIVTETLIKYKNGNDVLPAEEIKNLEEYGFFVLQGNSEYVTEKPVKYTLKTLKEGVIKLSIKVKNVEGYCSDFATDFYVINDNSAPEAARILFVEPGLKPTEVPIRFADENGNDNVPLFQIDGAAVEYYPGKFSKMDVEINYWDSDFTTDVFTNAQWTNLHTFSGVTPAEGKIDLSEFTIPRNCNKTTYVELKITTEAGNTYKKNHQIPKSSRVVSLNTAPDNTKEQTTRLDGATVRSGPFDLDRIATDLQVFPQNVTTDSDFDDILYAIYVKKSTEETYTFRGNSSASTNGFTIRASSGLSLEAGKTYDIGIRTFLGTTNGFTYTIGSDNYSYGCMTVKRVKYLGDNKFEADETPARGSINFPASASVTFGNDNVIKKNKNFIRCFISIDDTNFVPAENITYEPCLALKVEGRPNGILWYYDYQYNYSSDLSRIYAKYSYKYQVRINAVNSAGVIVDYKDYGDIDLSDSKFDNTAPTSSAYTSGYFEIANVRPDGFIVRTPTSSNSILYGGNYYFYRYEENNPLFPYKRLTSTQKILGADYKEYSIDNHDTYPFVFLPINGDINKNYTIFLRFEDERGNYLMYSYDVSTNMYDIRPEITRKDITNSDATLTVYKPNSNKNHTINYISYLKNGIWTGSKPDSNDGKSVIKDNKISGEAFDTFVKIYTYDDRILGSNEKVRTFYKTLYVYPKLMDATVNKKSVLECNNGYMVFADNKVLAHVLYCSTNLGEDEDIWASKGLEADVKILNGDSSYNPDYKTIVPGGNYYVPVFHFVDGTTAMGTVKYME